MNRSAKGGTRSSLHYGGEGELIHPPDQGVCGRHGTEEERVTSGGLSPSPSGSGVSKPISESEVGSEAERGVGRPNSTRSVAKAGRPGNGGKSEPGKAVGKGSREEKEEEKRKDGEEDQFHE